MQELTILGGPVGELLKKHRHTIAVAESSAGGMISASLLAVPGASKYFQGGGVIYTHEARRIFLGLPDTALAGIRASTEDYALKLATQVREQYNTTWGLSETGATGPAGNAYGDAAGHACFALVGPVRETLTLETGSTDREANMWAFTKTALDLLKSSIANTTS